MSAYAIHCPGAHATLQRDRIGPDRAFSRFSLSIWWGSVVAIDLTIPLNSSIAADPTAS